MPVMDILPSVSRVLRNAACIVRIKCSGPAEKCLESESNMSQEAANGDIIRNELRADRRRMAGGTIWQDLVLANVTDGQDVVDMLLDLMLELDDREQQIAVKRAIKKLNGIVQRDSRLVNFRESGGD